MNESLIKALFIASVLLLLSIWPASAELLTLSEDPVDYEFESEKVCCADVAAVNLLNYVDKQKCNEELIEDGKSIKDQQEDFHRKYDPKFTGKWPSSVEIKKAFECTFEERRFNAKVKLFYTKDLKYKTLLDEWNNDELIILMAIDDEDLGHTLFLWGLETDVGAPKLSVIDPNFHPNTEHKIDGQNTNSKGTSTLTDLNIGVDDKGLPDWRITYTIPEYTYKIGDIEETFDKKTFNYRILSFISVSDVKIESWDKDKKKVKNVFRPGEKVYVKGFNIEDDEKGDIYVFYDQTWKDKDKLVYPHHDCLAEIYDVKAQAGDFVGSPIELGIVKNDVPPFGYFPYPAKYDIVYDRNQNNTYDVDVDLIDKVSCTGFETIPEFTTIAIPVAAILGLLFLFSRRREEE